MAISSIGNTLSTGFLARVTGASSSSSKSVLGKSSSTPATFNATRLRVGAGTMANSIQRLNAGIAYLQESKETLGKLERIVDKVVAIAERGARSGTSGQRINLNAEYRKLAGEFHKIVAESADRKSDSLDVEDITTVLTNLGLDPKKASTIVEFFDNLDYPDTDRNLASDHVKGKRPLRIPDRIEETETIVPGDPYPTIMTAGGVVQTTSVRGIALSTDYDGDGNLDILIDEGMFTSSDVYLHRGNGDGSFSAGITVNAGAPIITGGVADFNSDGFIDTLYVYHTGGIGVLLNNGDGTFSTPLSQSTLTSQPDMINIVDINGDGLQDFVIRETDASDQHVSTYLSNGDGTFSIGGVTTWAGTSQDGISVGDIDGDSKPDLLVSVNTSTIEIYRNDGGGDFSTLYTTVTTPPSDVFGASLHDVDGDGTLDIFTKSGNIAGVALGNGDGTFAEWNTFATLPAGAAVGSLGDLTNDGVNDLIALNGNTLYIAQGNGDGSFSSPITYSFGVGGEQYVKPVVQDLNNDGLLDLFVFNEIDGTVNTFLQESQGSMPPTVIVTTEEVSSRTPKEWDAIFASGRTLSSVGDVIALREDAKRLRQEIHKNISVLDDGLDILEKNLGLVREIGLGILAVADSLDSDTAAERVARMIQQQVRQRGIRYFSELGNLNSITAATLLSNTSSSSS